MCIRDSPKAKVFVDKQAANHIKFRLADGSTASAHSLVVYESPFGWGTSYVINTESDSAPLLLGIRALKALNASVNFADNSISLSGEDCSRTKFKSAQSLQTTDRGHLLLDMAVLQSAN